MKKKNILLFTAGLGIGTLAGFILRNSESTDYNAGYQPDLEIFDEKDYFTDEIIEEYKKEKAERKKKQEESEYTPRHARKEIVQGETVLKEIAYLNDLAEIPVKKGKGYRGKTRSVKHESDS